MAHRVSYMHCHVGVWATGELAFKVSTPSKSNGSARVVAGRREGRNWMWLKRGGVRRERDLRGQRKKEEEEEKEISSRESMSPAPMAEAVVDGEEGKCRRKERERMKEMEKKKLLGHMAG